MKERKSLAEQMTDIAIEACKEEIESVRPMIEAAAKKGDTSILVSGLGEGTLAYLMRNGFTVDYGCTVTLRWK
jgi:hypothetical protein